MDHGSTQPITVSNSHGPARPSPSIFQSLGPARPVTTFRSARPGPDKRPMTSHGKKQERTLLSHAYSNITASAEMFRTLDRRYRGVVGGVGVTNSSDAKVWAFDPGTAVPEDWTWLETIEDYEVRTCNEGRTKDSKRIELMKVKPKGGSERS